jgi:phosphate transport system substrate-binding protein
MVRFLGLIASSLAMALVAGCDSGGETKNIEIDGSSTVYRLSVGAYELFRESDPGTKATINFAGTGGGFKKFVVGKLDIADASRPISQSEIDEARKNNVQFIELPVAFDALTVAVNAGNDWCTELSIDDLKNLWEPAAKDKVMRWYFMRTEWTEM